MRSSICENFVLIASDVVRDDEASSIAFNEEFEQVNWSEGQIINPLGKAMDQTCSDYIHNVATQTESAMTLYQCGEVNDKIINYWPSSDVIDKNELWRFIQIIIRDNFKA